MVRFRRTPVRAQPIRARWLVAALVVAGCLVVGAVGLLRCSGDVTVCARVAYHRLDRGSRHPTDLVWNGNGEVDLYGTQYVPVEDYGTVRELGVDTVLLDFPIDAGPERWRRQLDDAEAAGLSVVAWLWTPGWEWDPDTERWAFDDRALSFLDTVEGHPALFAVYATHEGYWNECFGCGYTTAQLQMLYRQIKERADVVVYSSFGEIALWAEMGAETTFADGICDYCDAWYYPVMEDGTYDRKGYRETLERELSTFRALAPNSKFVWVLQTFGSDRWDRSRPTEADLADMAAIAATADIDGIWWYPWTFAPEYEVVLADAPDLQAVVGRSAPKFGRSSGRQSRDGQ